MRRTQTRQADHQADYQADRNDFRHIYQPSPDRMPRWVWRLWAWF